MIDYSECDNILIKYRSKGILIDSNILLLLFIGSYNEHLISKFKRINNYSIEDYYLLLRLLVFFNKHITTPHILTEVSNLSKDLPHSNWEEYFAGFSVVIQTFEEKYVQSNEFFVENNPIIEFGLTDAAIEYSAKNNYLVLTNDGPLYGFLLNKEIDVLNFDDLLRSSILSK